MGYYDKFGLETKTALGPQPEGDFLLAENRDIFFIVRDDTTPGSPAKVAVHVLTADSGYQKFGLETKTALGPQPEGDFLLAENRDIFFIVRDDATPGSPAKVAVHILTADSGYQKFGLETKTALGPQPEGDFLLAENRDIFFIVRDDATPGSPAKVAVHVLTADSGYQKFGLETKTALGPQPEGVFLLANNNDLFFIVRDDTTPGSPPAVAVHVLGPGPQPAAAAPPAEEFYCLQVFDDDGTFDGQLTIQATSWDDARNQGEEVVDALGGDEGVLTKQVCPNPPQSWLRSTLRISRGGEERSFSENHLRQLKKRVASLAQRPFTKGTD